MSLPPLGSVWGFAVSIYFGDLRRRPEPPPQDVPRGIPVLIEPLPASRAGMEQLTPGVPVVRPAAPGALLRAEVRGNSLAPALLLQAAIPRIGAA
jgi:hypothetical protein